MNGRNESVAKTSPSSVTSRSLMNVGDVVSAPCVSKTTGAAVGFARL